MKDGSKFMWPSQNIWTLTTNISFEVPDNLLSNVQSAITQQFLQKLLCFWPVRLHSSWRTLLQKIKWYKWSQHWGWSQCNHERIHKVRNVFATYTFLSFGNLRTLHRWRMLFQVRNMCKIFSLIPSKKPPTRENWDKLSVYFSIFEW